MPDFNRTLAADGQRQAYLYASDVLMVAGEDLRPLPLLERRERLQRLLKKGPAALLFSEHVEADGEAIFQHACGMGWKASSQNVLTGSTVPAAARLAEGKEPRV